MMRSLLILILSLNLTGCWVRIIEPKPPEPTPIPTPTPTPTPPPDVPPPPPPPPPEPTPTPTPEPEICPYPLPETREIVAKVHVVGPGWTWVDSTPRIISDEFCTSIGYVGRHRCPVAPEGSPHSLACAEAFLVTKCPTWVGRAVSGAFVLGRSAESAEYCGERERDTFTIGVKCLTTHCTVIVQATGGGVISNEVRVER